MVKPCKITDKNTQICVENIKLGMSHSACAKAIGITHQTWLNWSKWGIEGKAPYAQWYIQIQEAEADLMKDCLMKLRVSAELGNIESVKFLLERRFPHEWGKQQHVNVQARSENVNVNVSPKMKQEETEKIRERILEKLLRSASIDDHI